MNDRMDNVDAFLDQCVALGLKPDQVAMLSRRIKERLTPLRDEIYLLNGKMVGKKMLAMALKLVAIACNEAMEEEQQTNKEHK